MFTFSMLLPVGNFF